MKIIKILYHGKFFNNVVFLSRRGGFNNSNPTIIDQ